MQSDDMTFTYEHEIFTCDSVENQRAWVQFCIVGSSCCSNPAAVAAFADELFAFYKKRKKDGEFFVNS